MAYIKYKELTKYFNFSKELDVGNLPTYVTDYLKKDEVIIKAYKTSRMGHQYKLHPDTHFQYKGLQIPKWNELLQLADKLARVLPTVRFVGFDLALTKNGWVMVEGNNNPQPVQQMVDQIGLRKEFDEMLARM